MQGLFQPDGAAVLPWMGRSYLVTANEGAARFYGFDGFEDDFDEDARGDDIIDGESFSRIKCTFELKVSYFII